MTSVSGFTPSACGRSHALFDRDHRGKPERGVLFLPDTNITLDYMNGEWVEVERDDHRLGRVCSPIDVINLALARPTVNPKSLLRFGIRFTPLRVHSLVRQVSREF